MSKTERKMLLENHKEVKIYLQYCTEFIEKNTHISGPEQFKPTCSRVIYVFQYKDRTANKTCLLGRFFTVMGVVYVTSVSRYDRTEKMSKCIVVSYVRKMLLKIGK